MKQILQVISFKNYYKSIYFFYKLIIAGDQNFLNGVMLEDLYIYNRALKYEERLCLSDECKDGS